ncbi:MAG: Asp-tRNA(Asn)/Glu-tRNA(Gln) amidotransferase GatCAB subunit C, partial [Planktomarina sp.]
IDSGGLGAHVQKSGLAAAHAAGVKFINIGPLKTDIEPDQTPEWLAAIPNTDVAIMMGISHTLISEDLHDPAFMDRYCTGFDQ